MLAPLTFSPPTKTRDEKFEAAKKFARDVAKMRRADRKPAGYLSINWNSAIALRGLVRDLFGSAVRS